jgi:hypothetical protein
MCSSTNKYKIAEYLLNQKFNSSDKNINFKKDNGGLTAIHRSVFYGSVGITVLIKNYYKNKTGDSCFDIFDDDYLIPLNYCCKNKEYKRYVGE